MPCLNTIECIYTTKNSLKNSEQNFHKAKKIIINLWFNLVLVYYNFLTKKFELSCLYWKINFNLNFDWLSIIYRVKWS